MKDHHRQARHGCIEIQAPELIVQRGEQQRGGFSADAGDSQQHAGEHAGARGAIAHTLNHHSAGQAESRGRFPQRIRHQQQHILGRTHDNGDDNDGEGNRPGKA